MDNQPSVNSETVHRHFSTHCFNQAWELIDKAERTADENERMIHLAHASVWHWTQRSGCTDKNLSIGYWQLSRIYALLGEAANALKYAQLCIDNTPADEAFCLGYAYEAMARAESLAGNHVQVKAHLDKARRLAEGISDPDERQPLEKDLQSLE